MKPEPEQWKLLSVIREVGTSLIKCDCVWLERLAEHCGTLTDETFIDGSFVSDQEANLNGDNLHSRRQVATGQLELLGKLLESTKGTLKILDQSGLIRSVHMEYHRGFGRGE